jgi:hypothetical protein
MATQPLQGDFAEGARTAPTGPVRDFAEGARTTPTGPARDFAEGVEHTLPGPPRDFGEGLERVHDSANGRAETEEAA